MFYDQPDDQWRLLLQFDRLYPEHTPPKPTAAPGRDVGSVQAQPIQPVEAQKIAGPGAGHPASAGGANPARQGWHRNDPLGRLRFWQTSIAAVRPTSLQLLHEMYGGQRRLVWLSDL